MDVQLLIVRRALVGAALFLLAGCASTGDELATPELHRGLTVVDRDGAQHALDGQAAVLIFWQPWCAACREEAPAAVAASADQGGAVRFFGVVSGPDEAVDEALVDKSIDELGLSYPQVRDRDLALARRFRVSATPTIVVLDGDGRLRYRGSHLPTDWSVAR